jgi:hypothetical protein
MTQIEMTRILEQKPDRELLSMATRFVSNNLSESDRDLVAEWFPNTQFHMALMGMHVILLGAVLGRAIAHSPYLDTQARIEFYNKLP